MVSTACESSAAGVAVEVSAAERTSAANVDVFLLIFFLFSPLFSQAYDSLHMLKIQLQLLF